MEDNIPENEVAYKIHQNDLTVLMVESAHESQLAEEFLSSIPEAIDYIRFDLYKFTNHNLNFRELLSKLLDTLEDEEEEVFIADKDMQMLRIYSSTIDLLRKELNGRGISFSYH